MIIASSSHPYCWQSTLQMDCYRRHWGKGRDWKIYCCVSTLSFKPFWKSHVVIWQTTSKNCTKVRAARAARLFFLIQPIKSLICGVVVAVVIVVRLAYCCNENFTLKKPCVRLSALRLFVWQTTSLKLRVLFSQVDQNNLLYWKCLLLELQL